MAGNTT